MRIYRFWSRRVVPFRGSNAVFLGASNESAEQAERMIDRKIEWAKRWSEAGRKRPSAEEIREMNLFFADGRIEEEYEVPIREEVVQVIDHSNLVTRNRYGALVLNSETLPFLDLDSYSPRLAELLGGLFGRPLPRTAKERIVHNIERLSAKPAYAGYSFRVYETCRGIRLLLSTPLQPASSPRARSLMRDFQTDPLYAELCARQNCYRARLTPKPGRIHMKSGTKFRFPYEPEALPALEAWKAEYEKRSKSFAVCKLLTCIGEDFRSPALEYHDKACGVNSGLPLA